MKWLFHLEYTRGFHRTKEEPWEPLQWRNNDSHSETILWGTTSNALFGHLSEKYLLYTITYAYACWGHRQMHGNEISSEVQRFFLFLINQVDDLFVDV